MTIRLVIATIIGFTIIASNAHSQAAQAEVTLRFKVFDANKPDRRLSPTTGILFLRDRVTLEPEFPKRVGFENAENDFAALKIEKSKLIEQLVISVPGYNPAVIAKTVTAADIQVYPGASHPAESFSFPAFLGQLAAYRSLYNIFENEFGESRQNEIQSLLLEDFEDQLRIMQTAERDGKLINYTPEQMRKARAALEEVLVLYGLKQERNSFPTPPTICFPRPSCVFPLYDGVQTEHSIATISVTVPAKATVHVNGYRTKSTGTNRRFAAGNLMPGTICTFEVRANVIRDEQKIHEVKTIKVRAGTTGSLAFDLKGSLQQTEQVKVWRLWNDRSGKYQIMAKYAGVAVIGGSRLVNLSRQIDGQIVKVPLAKLSDEDRWIVEGIIKRANRR